MLRDPRPRPTSADPPGTRPEAVQLRARRSPKLIALGVLLVVLGGIGAGTLFTLGRTNQAVVTMAVDATRGHVLQKQDLQVVELPTTALHAPALPAAELDSLVGQRLLVDLPKGSYPTLEHVGDDPLPDGEAIVGLMLGPGRLPTTELPPGTRVQLIGFGEHELKAEAVVLTAPTTPDGGSSFSLNVRLPEAEAALAAAAMAADSLSLIVVEEA